MKNNGIKLVMVAIGSWLVLMIFGAIYSVGAAETAGNTIESFVSDFCFEGKIGKKELDVYDLNRLYLEKTNLFFNVNIKKLMTDLKTDYPTPDLNEYGKVGDKICGDQNDMACKAIAVCKDNPSAYCVGVTAMGFTPEHYSYYQNDKLENYKQLKYSYFCYKAGLEKLQDDVYAGTTYSTLEKCDRNESFKNSEEVCKTREEWKTATDPNKKAALEMKMVREVTEFGAGPVDLQNFNLLNTSNPVVASTVSGLTLGMVDFASKSAEKMAFSEKEIKRAKVTLDQTLDAYSQLRTAWIMHTRYVDTFAALVKYRDGLVKIRKETDVFPFRFVDATTSHCI